MSKKKEENGEQLDLLDVQPENAKVIISAARLYKKFQAARQSALEDEVKQKQKILSMVREVKLQPLGDGKIRFRCDGVIITVTPRDELITVKDTEEAT